MRVSEVASKPSIPKFDNIVLFEAEIVTQKATKIDGESIRQLTPFKRKAIKILEDLVAQQAGSSEKMQ